MLKRDLNIQLRKLQEKIDIGDENFEDVHASFLDKENLLQKIESQRERLEVDSLNNSLSNNQKHELKLLVKELDKFKVKLNRKFDSYVYFVDADVEQLLELIDSPVTGEEEEQQSLNPQRIQQFEPFQADESIVGDQCVICMGDVEIGRNMMRLDCDGQHTFCQVCIEGWFADQNTCPTCGHEF